MKFARAALALRPISSASWTNVALVHPHHGAQNDLDSAARHILLHFLHTKPLSVNRKHMVTQFCKSAAKKPSLGAASPALLRPGAFPNRLETSAHIFGRLFGWWLRILNAQ